MELLSAKLPGGWRSLQPESDDDEHKVHSEEAHAALKGVLTDTLTATNLVVLTGLGTSMCVSNANGARLAPSLEDLWNQAESNLPNFQRVLADVGFDLAAHGENLEAFLSRCHLAQAMSPTPRVTAFVEAAEALIVAKCSFVDSGALLPTHEAFIRLLARRSPRKLRLKLFTLNYDLCFEVAASRCRFVVVDGFSHTLPQQFDSDYFAYDIVRREEDRPAPDYIPNVFHLYKLHGSVDWGRAGTEVVRTENPVQPVIIYPRATKFEASYSPPFIDMIARFQSALRQPDTGLLVIGFGFRDAHITQPILSAIRSNVGIRAVVVSREIEESPGTATGILSNLIGAGDRRITLVRGLFEELVQLLPDLAGPTETELLAARLRGVTEVRA